jgi:uncharacterized protein YgiM (DUF1202 family)
MKMNLWLIFGHLLSTSLLAQQVTNPAPAAPISPPTPAVTTTAPAAATNAAVTNASAAKPEKKKSTKKKSAPTPSPKKVATGAELKTVPLVPGPAVVRATRVNVRGQAKLKSEVVTQLTNGQPVTVIEEIVKNNSGPDEPSAWAKIALPASAHVWVNSSFIDASNKTVKPKHLNLRGGPGENFSVLGRLDRGTTVKEVTTKGAWTQVEAPADAYAFVAAAYLRQEGSGENLPPVVAANTKAPETKAAETMPEVKPTPVTVSNAPTVVAAPTGVPPIPTAPDTVTATTSNAPTTSAIVSNAPPAPVELVKRVVSHEGVVRGMTSIQAPSHFVLYSPETGQNIDYLYTTARDLDLRRYKGLRVIVTGEESLDERWGNTPVITIQRIQPVAAE